MKKTISINLQGIIFHVEEDGYALLNSYLTSVKSYFLNFEGHDEIMADIESRMAELFLTRLSPGKQIISLEDVQHLIGRMGSVQDFAAQNEADEAEAAASAGGAPYTSSAYTDHTTGLKKLYLDVRRKKLAGVAAGIANYLGIDPLWIRLAFVFVALVGSPFTAGGAVGVALITYIVLWIVLPPSEVLPETKTKKLYRDPDNKKLAGVSGGLGAYFGIDPLWIRLFFLVLLFFFGTGVFLYIILWLIMPEAHTPSEKAEMRGNPVTLSSIEEAVRKNSAFRDERGQENVLARIVLLPVQLLSQIFESLGPALKTIVLFLLEAIRILAGIVLVLFGLMLIIASVAMLLAGLGLISEASVVHITDVPAELFSGDLPWYGVVAGFLAVLIPGIWMLISGLSLIAKRTLMRATAGWTLFGVWLASLIALAIAAGVYGSNFRQTGTFTEEKRFAVAPGMLLLSASDREDNGQGMKSHNLDLTLEPGNDSTALVLINRYKGNGSNTDKAIQSARMIEAPVIQTDSALVFSSRQLFKPGAKYRKNQQLGQRLLIPEGKAFRIDASLAELVDFSPTAGLFSAEDLVGNTLMFRKGKLNCLTCSAADSVRASEPQELTDIPAGANSKSYSLNDFDQVEAAGALTLVITQGDQYTVKAYGDRDGLKKLDLDLDGEVLKIENKRSFWGAAGTEPVMVVITMPDLRSFSLAGSVTGKVSGFTGNDLELALVGAATADVDVRCQKLTANLVGASTLNATGTADRLEADIVGASELNAFGLITARAEVESMGASKAKVHATERLDAHAAGASTIRYKGSPKKVKKQAGGASSVSAD